MKWSCQGEIGEVKAVEHDFSAPLREDGVPDGWGWPNFMPISETYHTITLEIFSVQLPG